MQREKIKYIKFIFWTRFFHYIWNENLKYVEQNLKISAIIFGDEFWIQSTKIIYWSKTIIIW